MATQKVFWADPYCTRLSSRVSGVNGDHVTLERTIFFAFSGGQESDHGTIAGLPVLDARTDGLEIVYTLAENHPLRPGDEIDVSIDWPRRYRLMRLHLAAEIVLELMCRELGSIDKIGAHIAADKARMDFAWPDSIATNLANIHRQATELIAADQPIISAFSNPQTQRRYWEIDGFARVPCGGTHLQRTGEIGELDLRRKNPGKGKERIEIRVADSA